MILLLLVNITTQIRLWRKWCLHTHQKPQKTKSENCKPVQYFVVVSLRKGGSGQCQMERGQYFKLHTFIK